MSHQPSTEKELEIDVLPIRRALISVFDKSGLDTLARALAAKGVELYSTGGTEKCLKGLGLDVRSVSDLTHFPEVFDGRVKTLHPMVHGGLLFRRELPSHIAQAAEHGVEPIDLLVINLYPFEETLAKPGATQQEIIEQIDIGGPAMLRSAAKNFRGVALLTSASQYDRFLTQYNALDGASDVAMRLELARDAFEQVARYDRAIADHFDTLVPTVKPAPDRLTLNLPLIQTLRYGENPQQSAALYGEAFSKICTQLWGKELSYNNILDTSASLGLIAEFMGSDAGWQEGPAVAAIIKHTNPCGVAEGATGLDAFNRAYSTDPESPFGGIIVVTKPLDLALAERLNEFFSEVILAPSFDDDAMAVLKKKKDRRLIRFDAAALYAAVQTGTELRSVVGGVLQQSTDRELMSISEVTSVTSAPVTDAMERGLRFAWKVVKHLKSNAIAFCGIENGYARTLGLGAGQTSRVESSRLAVYRAKHHGLDLAGSFVASDAFYPFADGLLEAADAGAIAAIEPGGSVRDAEVVAAAEERKMALVMTGMRHFKH